MRSTWKKWATGLAFTLIVPSFAQDDFLEETEQETSANEGDEKKSEELSTPETRTFEPSAAEVETTEAKAPTPEDDLSLKLVKEKLRKEDKKLDEELNEPENQSKKISLRDILEEGLRKNAGQNIRSNLSERFDLGWKDTYQKFWLPQVDMALSTSPQRLTGLKQLSSAGQRLNGTSRTADGTVGLEVADYTLFNWGRDYLKYQNDQKTYERQKQILLEQRRALKFQLITGYFDVVRNKEIQRARRDLLRHTSFIHRLSKQKMALRRIGTMEYQQTKAEFLNAQNNYQEAKYQTAISEETLANLLNDLPQTRYTPAEDLKFIELKTESSEAVNLALKQSPQFRNAKLAFENAHRSYEKTLKDNLPLPKISMNMGAYQFGFDRNGSSTQFQTGPNSSNVEIVAMINMTWAILGENGFFNYRQKQRSYLDKKVSEIDYDNTKRQLELRIQVIFRTVKYQETQVKIAESRLDTAQTVFDSVLDNYIGQKATFADIKIALDNLMNAEINYQNIKFQHMQNKLALSDLMGLEDLPGENFENLAQK